MFGRMTKKLAEEVRWLQDRVTSLEKEASRTGKLLKELSEIIGYEIKWQPPMSSSWKLEKKKEK